MAADPLPARFRGEVNLKDRSRVHDDDVVNADGLMTPHDGGGCLRPLPVTVSGGRQRGAADLGGGRRAAVMTQYLGESQPGAISVVEEERTSDDDVEDDCRVSGSSTGTAVNDGVAQYVIDFPHGSRMRYPRTSLLGKPLDYRRRDTRLKRLQSRAYIFLERPKTCPAITYHTAV